MVKVPIPCHGCTEYARNQTGQHIPHVVERYYDGYTTSNLDLLKEAVRLNWDGVLVYGGYEGDGKSTKCAQDMAYLDPTFDLSRVVFTVEDLARLMDTLPPGSAIQFDETWKDASNQNRYGKDQRKLIRVLTEKRKKRLYIGFIAATFFDLNKYFIIHRARAYIHVYAHGLERGYFSFFNRQEKQDLYIKGRRDWNLQVAEPSFRGRFTNWMPFNPDEYERKKDDATKEVGEEKLSQFEMGAYKDGQDEVLLYLRDVVELWQRGPNHGLFQKIAEHLDMNPQALNARISKYRDEKLEKGIPLGKYR